MKMKYVVREMNMMKVNRIDIMLHRNCNTNGQDDTPGEL
jgi:hypothetical protein